MGYGCVGHGRLTGVGGGTLRRPWAGAGYVAAPPAKVRSLPAQLLRASRSGVRLVEEGAATMSALPKTDI